VRSEVVRSERQIVALEAQKSLLETEFVRPGWVSREEFIAGYGAAQAVPGPLFTFAAYLGAISHQSPSGWVGGAWALVAIFLPSFLLIVGTLALLACLGRRTALIFSALTAFGWAALTIVCALNVAHHAPGVLGFDPRDSVLYGALSAYNLVTALLLALALFRYHRPA